LNLRWRFKLLKLYWNEKNGDHNVGPLLLSFLETAGQGPVGWVIALHIDRPKFVDRPKVISREKAPCEVFFFVILRVDIEPCMEGKRYPGMMIIVATQQNGATLKTRDPSPRAPTKRSAGDSSAPPESGSGVPAADDLRSTSGPLVTAPRPANHGKVAWPRGPAAAQVCRARRAPHPGWAVTGAVRQ
jgi:hypothetical protein